MGSIAVVIPCFNDGAMLESAVASAETQDAAPKIVVVDDGSTDPASLALLQRLEHRGIHVIRQENQGPAPARMAGVRATDADHVFALEPTTCWPRAG
jgi:glycosyltransferase involved in cell wall biosynthesis